MAWRVGEGGGGVPDGLCEVKRRLTRRCDGWDYCALARQGAVLLSPCVSEVARRAFAEAEAWARAAVGKKEERSDHDCTSG